LHKREDYRYLSLGDDGPEKYPLLANDGLENKICA